MHELSVCLSLLQQVEQIAAEKNALRVTKIVLSIGPLSGVESELLRRAYPMAAADTVAAAAELVMESSDIVVRCSQCNAESRATANRLLCAACGDFRTRVLSGDELTLLSVELDTG
jgi:hydrogenase nickel incorporation protein HypA/HybF